MPLYRPGEIVGYETDDDILYDKIVKVIIEISEASQAVSYVLKNGNKVTISESRIKEPIRKAVPIRIFRTTTNGHSCDDIEENPKCGLCHSAAHTGGC